MGTKSKDLLEGLYVPPPPQLFNDVRAAGSDLVKVAEIIAKDAGVSAKLLRTVNSPAFGLSNQVGSIQQATVLLGLDSVLNIVNTVLLRQMIKGVNTQEIERFWDISTDIGLCCAYLARLVQSVPPDEAYALGLFHNCGMPLIMQKSPGYNDVLRIAYQDPDGDISGAEQIEIGTCHADIGYKVAKLWNLPEYMCNAIEYHHDIDADEFHSSLIEDPLAVDHLSILKLSEHLCKLHFNIGGVGVDHEWKRLEAAVLSYTGISEAQFFELEDRIEGIIAKG